MDRVWSVVKAVVAVLSGLAAAGGITLDVFQVGGFDPKLWTLVAFIVFCVFVIWITVGLYNRNKELENAKPSISVKPRPSDDIWYLEVTNTGEKGMFTAEVSVFNKLEIDSKYQEIGAKYHALWGNSNTDEADILNGQTDIIKLAAITYTNTNKYFEMRGYDTVKKCPYSVRRIEFDDFKNFTDEQIVQVNISAAPSLSGGAFVREYSISLRGIAELVPQKRVSAPDPYMFGEREDDKEIILTQLSNFLPDGEKIREQCYKQNGEVPKQEAKDWAEEVAKYLDTLGQHYRLTFFNSDGLGEAKIPPLYYGSLHRDVALFVSYRLMRIQQFLEEFRDK